MLLLFNPSSITAKDELSRSTTKYFSCAKRLLEFIVINNIIEKNIFKITPYSYLS
jgi:hypothetical protein